MIATAPFSSDPPPPDRRLDAELLGREREIAALEALVEALRAGHGTALVLRGETGIGKTALLDTARRHAHGCDVVLVTVAQTEMDLRYAVLHQLCRPLAPQMSRLPAPQRAALDAAFGLVAAETADRLLLSLAVLDLFTAASADRPLLCLVDDAQWMDQASAGILSFVARRLAGEAVGFVFATQETPPELGDLPELALGGLSDSDASALLASSVRRPLDQRVRDRIIAEAAGNPATLLAVGHVSRPSTFAGGFDDPAAIQTPADERRVIERISALSEDARMVLLLAAAEPTGDPILLWTAAQMLGIHDSAADEAHASGLLAAGAPVRFCDPLVRGTVYRSARVEELQLAHGALAAATDGAEEPERHAWHSAREVSMPNERIAAELERSASSAAAHGGIAATAAFLHEATALTPERATRARRALAAAEASHLAGDVDGAARVLATAEAAPLDAVARARTHLLRARLAARSGDPRPAQSLLDAARQLEPLDPDRAREAYLDALGATIVLGGHADTEPAVIARAALAFGAAPEPRPVDLLLEGLSRHVLDGLAAAVPTLRRALAAFDSDDVPAATGFGWGWLASYVAAAIWDNDAHAALARRHVRLARREGALATLPLVLSQLVGLHLRNGDLDDATAVMREIDAVAQTTGGGSPDYLQMLLAAYEGREEDARELVDAAAGQPGERLGGSAAVLGHFAAGVLYNGLGRYDDALAGTRGALVDPEPVAAPGWALVELVEAAARAGAPLEAAAACERLSDRARACGTDWALGNAARGRALLSRGDEAERLYAEAISCLSMPGLRVDLARTRLLYGEWLRREGRRVDARTQLRIAESLLSDMGIEAFAERARRELRATGETARKRTADTRDDLTAQELQIARLARAGLSNPEIGERLYLSPRTVEWHLRKVFAKLEVRSRLELVKAIPEDDLEPSLG